MSQQTTLLKAGIGLIAVAIGLAVPYLWSGSATHHQASVKQPPPTVIEASASLSAEHSKAKEVPAIDYGKSFAEAHDYWDYAHQILPAAQMGDADAQFYLSRVLEHCSSYNRMFLQHRGVTLTPDQAIQWALQRHLSLDVVQAAYDHCHEFLEHDSAELGSAPDWLARATAAGQPIAQATTAEELAMQEVMQSLRPAGAAPNPDAPAAIESQQSPRQLLQAAVQSRNPEVLFIISGLQGYLNSAPGEIGMDSAVGQAAWQLVACERGLDCSANAEWVKIACANDARCASFTDHPSDLARTFSGEDWGDVQQFAQQIDAELDAGQWDELGIGSP